MTPLEQYSSEEEFGKTPILDTIDGPERLAELSMEELTALADEIRRKLIATVAHNGGHLASPLGVVELTIGLHRVFDASHDRIIWDVGHQCYPHKLLTGRRDSFDTLRKRGGISGYPKRSESPYDVFDVGHSSTSISAALGMAVARDRRGEDYKVVSVIGDGAMTAGMAFEALNHAGHLGTDLLVILNDNEMSISHSVGALSSYFNRLITGAPYSRARADFKSLLQGMLGERITETTRKLEHSVKGFITPGGFFQELGFHYFGPVDGHDLPALLDCLSNIKDMTGPILFHAVTQKGKGYQYAEENPQKYHGVGRYDIWTGELEGEARPPEREQEKVEEMRSFSTAFGEAVVRLADDEDRVVGITAAMPAGTGLSYLMEKYPDRCYDVSICEQHAVTFAAGLAAAGLRPICAIYSTFFQRGYDQFIHDVCLQNLPVIFGLDRAGVVGEDAPTHTGAFDLSFLRSIPNATILAPRDGRDLEDMLRWAVEQQGPVVLRYPRGKCRCVESDATRDVRHGEILRSGADATFLAVGPCVAACLKAAELLESDGFSVGVADARFIKPLDSSLLEALAHLPLIITVEENALQGGFGSAVLEYFECQEGPENTRIRRVGIPDEFGTQATRSQQLAEYGLNAGGLADTAREHLARTATQKAQTRP